MKVLIMEVRTSCGVLEYMRVPPGIETGVGAGSTRFSRKLRP